jgi:hypothetical protein
MSSFFNDRFVSRRGFLGRTLAGAATATALGAIAADKSKEPNPFAYDVSRFVATDPKLIRYEQKRTFATPHKSPRAIALAANGNLLIGAGKFVSELKPDGSLVAEFATTEEVRCMTADGEKIYVGSRERIEVFNAKGERKAAWEKPADKTYFTSLTVGANDLFAIAAALRPFG